MKKNSIFELTTAQLYTQQQYYWRFVVMASIKIQTIVIHRVVTVIIGFIND